MLIHPLLSSDGRRHQFVRFNFVRLLWLWSYNISSNTNRTPNIAVALLYYIWWWRSEVKVAASHSIRPTRTFHAKYTHQERETLNDGNNSRIKQSCCRSTLPGIHRNIVGRSVGWLVGWLVGLSFLYSTIIYAVCRSVLQAIVPNGPHPIQKWAKHANMANSASPFHSMRRATN